MANKTPKPLGKEAYFTLSPGKYWMLSPGRTNWNKYSRVLVSDNPKNSFKIFEVLENRDEDATFVGIEVKEPIKVLKAAIPRYGNYQDVEDRFETAGWEQPSPSMIHDASEALDRLSNYGDAITKAAWAVGGVALILWFTSRRK